MNRRILGACPAALVLALVATPARAQTTILVSVGPNGAYGSSGHCSTSQEPSISSDGHAVAFASNCPDYGGGDNFAYDVYVRDVTTWQTVLISEHSTFAGIAGNGSSTSPSISGDGDFVAFASSASDLVLGDTNALADIFVRDVQAQTTTRASVSTGGAQGNDQSLEPSLSADGRHVAFESRASNLAPGDTALSWDIFVRDLPTSQTSLVSVDSSGTKANGNCFSPEISQDGRYVVFQSEATNLVGTDANGFSDIFVRDRLLGVTTRVSVDSFGAEGNGHSSAPAISPDCRYVAFTSEATNLDGVPPGAGPWIYVHDRQTGQTERIAQGGAAYAASMTVPGDVEPSLSADGRYVGFSSTDATLVGGDTNGLRDLFVHDRQLATFERVSVDSDGVQGNDLSFQIDLSDDGRFAAITSSEDSFVVYVGAGSAFVYRHDRNPDPGTSFCFGDGSLATPCPCAPPDTVPSPSGFPDHGCANSFSPAGAELDVAGKASPDSVQFYAEVGVGYLGFGFLVKGNGQNTSGIANGDGVRCVDGALVRFGGHNAGTNGSGHSTWAYPNAVQTTAVSSATLQTPGQTAYYQLFYRHAAPGFCSPGTTNWSNGVRIDW